MNWPPPHPPDTPEWERNVEYYLQCPRILHLERVTEELPDDLQAALNDWDTETGDRCQYPLSIAPGFKIGGWESWYLHDMYELPCDVCGTESEPLLTLDSCE